jgi:hypothetical protein
MSILLYFIVRMLSGLSTQRVQRALNIANIAFALLSRTWIHLS